MYGKRYIPYVENRNVIINKIIVSETVMVGMLLQLGYHYMSQPRIHFHFILPSQAQRDIAISNEEWLSFFSYIFCSKCTQFWSNVAAAHSVSLLSPFLVFDVILLFKAYHNMKLDSTEQAMLVIEWAQYFISLHSLHLIVSWNTNGTSRFKVYFNF